MVRKIVYSDGSISHYNEQYRHHRLDGPAKEFSDGTKWWYINGLVHREDGPAVEYPNGDKCWFINNLRHRIDGPSVEYIDGHKAYHIMGKSYSYENWLMIKDFPLLW